MKKTSKKLLFVRIYWVLKSTTNLEFAMLIYNTMCHSVIPIRGCNPYLTYFTNSLIKRYLFNSYWICPQIWSCNWRFIPEGWHILEHEGEREVAQSCPTLSDPTDCSPPGSSVHGIFQAIVLEWIAISFSRGSSQPRDRNWVSRIVDRRFTVWAAREVLYWSIELL